MSRREALTVPEKGTDVQSDKTTFRRRTARFVVAGALITVPLSAFAVTAHAQTATDAPVEFETTTVAGEATPEATEIHDRRPDHPGRPGQTIIIPGPDAHPGGPRIEHREYREDPGPDHGPRIFHHRPSTGSASIS
ncbi:hypothetical protein GCM10027088_30290 [Nocardia goodfellowii]